MNVMFCFWQHYTYRSYKCLQLTIADYSIQTRHPIGKIKLSSVHTASAKESMLD